jgi:hypothetical protein
MKYQLLILLLNFTLIGNCKDSSIDYTSLYINGGKSNLNLIFKDDSKLLEIEVRKLFDSDNLNHLDSKAYNKSATFEKYWNLNHENWNLIDLNNDQKMELIYISKIGSNEDHFTELYYNSNKSYKLIFKELGRVEAFKINQNTQEIVLFHHQYPCCSSASHNVNMLRFLRNKIRLRKKYFIAGKQNMKGDFYPEKVNYNLDIKFLRKKTSLRWSPEVISKSAWIFLDENRIAEFEKGSTYRLLFKKKNWYFVLFLDPPVKSKPGTTVIQPDNFMNTHIFGWIKK